MLSIYNEVEKVKLCVTKPKILLRHTRNAVEIKISLWLNALRNLPYIVIRTYEYFCKSDGVWGVLYLEEKTPYSHKIFAQDTSYTYFDTTTDIDSALTMLVSCR